MLYRELAPSRALQPFVRCYWQMQSSGDEPAEVERIVPDGCAEIVLNRADRFRRLHTDGGSHVQDDVLLVGQMKSSIAIAPTGSIDLFGVRFEPAGLFAVLGIPMHELTERDLCLGQADAELRQDLERACDEPETELVVAAVEAALERRLIARDLHAFGAGEVGLVSAAVRRFERVPPGAEAVARALGVSRRSLERAFRREVGLPPRLYLRIRRLQRVLGRLEEGVWDPAGVRRSWADLAAEGGYADQSHLIRDFRLLAGTTPERYLAERSPMAERFESKGESHSSNPGPPGRS